MTSVPSETEVSQLLSLLEEDATSEQSRAITLGYLGSRILTAIHSQLIGTAEFGVLAQYDIYFSLHPGELHENPELALHDCRGRFVIGEVRSGKSNKLRLMAWQLLGVLLEDEAHGRAVSKWRFDPDISDEEVLESIDSLEELRDGVLLTPWEHLDRDIRARRALLKSLEIQFDTKNGAEPLKSGQSRIEQQIDRTRDSIEELVQERDELIQDHHDFLIDGTNDEPLVAGGSQAGDNTYIARLIEIFDRDPGVSPMEQLFGMYLIEVGRIYKKWVEALKQLPEGSLRACPHLWLEDYDSLQRFYLNPESAQW